MSRTCVALAAALAATACGERSGVVTLSFWGLGREGEVAAELIAEFERTHPGIRVDVQQVPFTAAHEKLLTAYVGDSTPDIAQLGNTWLPELAALDALTPLDPAIAGSQIVDAADYFPGIWETNRVDGVQYGVPWYVDTRLLFYRHDLLAEAGFAVPPVTWAEWLTAMRAIKARVGPSRYAILLPLNEFEQLVSLGLQQDEPLLRDHDRYGNFRSPGFRRALGFYFDIFAERLAPVANNIEVNNPWDELGRGWYSFLIHGPWTIGELKRRLPPSQQSTWSTMPLPGPNGPGAAIAGGCSLVVFRRSKHAREAWLLIEYLSRPEIQRQFYAMTGDLPPRRSAWRDPLLAADPYIAAFRDQLERVERTPAVPEWERIAGDIRIVSERYTRQITPATTAAQREALIDAATAELDARTDQILEKRRWVLDKKAAALRVAPASPPAPAPVGKRAP